MSKCILNINKSLSNETEIKNSLKQKCEKLFDSDGKSLGKDEACLFYNGNPKYPENKAVSLCITEQMTNQYDDLYKYPFLNKYYCMGWNNSAVEA